MEAGMKAGPCRWGVAEGARVGAASGGSSILVISLREAQAAVWVRQSTWCLSSGPRKQSLIKGGGRGGGLFTRWFEAADLLKFGPWVLYQVLHCSTSCSFLVSLLFSTLEVGKRLSGLVLARGRHYIFFLAWID